MRYSNSLLPVRIFKIVVLFLFLIVSLNILTSCMMLGMHGKNKTTRSSTEQRKPQSESTLIDKLIYKAVSELSNTRKLNISSLAVWKIESQEPGLDKENIRLKIINSLVNNTAFKVLSRKHLAELMAEQSLSLSGIIDSTKAVNIGGLIGVEGFVTGYITKQKNRIELSLNLIKTSSGEVVWSTHQQEKRIH